MPEIHEIGAHLYVQFLWLNRDAPLLEKAPTQESEQPYRTGRALVIRLWPSTRAIVVGRWVGRIEDPHEAELAALRLISPPRPADEPYWCVECGRSQCRCEPDEDLGHCPVCRRVWDMCPCLKVDWFYAGSRKRLVDTAFVNAMATVGAREYAENLIKEDA